MNILIINHYAGSLHYGMEYRPYYLAREWVKQGHQVTVVAASFSHLRNNQPEIRKDLSKEKVDGITYLWLKTPEYSGSGLKRVLNIFSFVLKLTLFRNRIAKLSNPNVVIASSTYPLDIYPARAIAKRTNAKLIFEMHDMWPMSPMLIGGYSKNHPFIWMMQKAENFACRNCDAYVSLLANTKSYLEQHGLHPDKFKYIPNGYSTDEVNLDSNQLPFEHESLLNRLQTEKKLIVGYAGGHAPSNALKTLLLAAEVLKKETQIAFVLVGNGSEKNELIRMAKQANLSNIYFLPSVSKNVVHKLLTHFDLLFAGGVKNILHSYGTSFNKITDYMLAAKPIIFAVDEPNSLIEKTKSGIQIPAENEKSLVDAIMTITKMTQESRKEMGDKGQDYAIKYLNYKKLAAEFLFTAESLPIRSK